MIKHKETFSEQVKRELTSLKFEDHCLKALLSSFISNRLTIVLKNNQEYWRLTSQFDFIITFIDQAFKQLYPDVKINKVLSKTATNINGLTNYIEIQGNFDLINNDLCLNENASKEILCKNECCKRAYVAGAFLASGSVNSLDAKSYHLEIRSNNYMYLVYLQVLLANFTINAVLTKHTKKQFILYVKKADQISDFLKLISAGNSMLAFEDRKISKDFNMQITRLNNLDISNINKSSVVGVKQVRQIKLLQKSDLYKKQSDKFKKFCELRLKNQESSLSELAMLMQEKYNIKITRAGLNHFGIKLNRLERKLK